MKKDLTELVMILDRSGSMHGLEADTIGGYNSMLEKQRAAEGEVLVSTVLFDGLSDVIHDRVPIGEVRPITERDYRVGGCTALLDALGGAIRHIRTVQRYARPEDRPEKTIFVVITDGMENASRHFDYAAVKRLVEQQKEAAGWEFLFLGANIDAVEVAGHFGITPDRAVRYHSDARGTALNYKVLGETVCAMRTAPEPVGAAWKEAIEEDYATREDGEKTRKGLFRKAKKR